MSARPLFSCSNAELRELAESNREGVAAELAHRKSRGAQRLALDLGCATLETPRTLSKRRSRETRPKRPVAPASPVLRVLRSREVEARKSYECAECSATIAGGEAHGYVVTTSPSDGFATSRYCHVCTPAWAVEGAAIPLEPEPFDAFGDALEIPF